MFNLIRGFRYLSILRPVKERPIVFMGIEILPFIHGKKRFMGIKSFYLQEPIVLVFVGLDKFQPFLKRFRLRLGFFFLDIFPVYPVLPPVPPQLSGRPGICYLPFPMVPFLAADDFPGIVPVMIGSTSILPIMIMIAHQMSIHLFLFQQSRHGIIERLYWSPAPVQKIIPSRMEFPPGRHAGKTPGIAVFKGYGLFS
jgi:hypothetical protein